MLCAVTQCHVSPTVSDHSPAHIPAHAPSPPRQLAALRGKGGEAILQPGDALFIPHHWWHHIHAAPPPAAADSPPTPQPTAAQPDSAISPTISLNFWFNPFEELLVPAFPLPLQPQIHAQLARAAESLLAGPLPQPALAAESFAECVRLLTGSGEPCAASPASAPTSAESPSTAALKLAAARRNYVLGALCAIYGRPGARRFCEALLDPARWGSLRRTF